MDAGEDQNPGTTNGNSQTSGNSHTPQIPLSLYERQAVQALQALQRQPNAAQYFQQLMLQQQIANSAQFHNLAAVQQATLAASRQPNTTSNSISQVPTTVNLSTTSAGGTMSSPRPHGPATSATKTTLNQSVQNLALHCASTTKAVAVKSELPERKDASSFPLGQQQQQNFPQTAQQQQVQPQQQQQMAKSSFTHQSTTNPLTVKTGNQAAMTVTPASSVPPSSTSSPALPLSQLLLAPSAAPVILVPTSNVPTSTQGYPIGSVAPKANVNTQTLVVQPLQQSTTTVDKGPVPIQPKTVQGHRLPVQLPPRHPPPILPAPPSNNQATAAGHNPPHIPVQLVGARQGLAGNVQAVALAQIRNSTAQESPSGGNVGTASSNSTMVRSKDLLLWFGVGRDVFVQGITKPAIGSLKRKFDCDALNEITESSDSAPMKDSAPPLSPAPTKDSAPPSEATFSSPPTLSLPLPLSRVGHGDKDRAPVPQAVVKPQVLTHVIEGFVIQEGAEPFPVTVCMVSSVKSFFPFTVLKCEYCGSLAPANQFRGSKRFCTNSCAKRYNVSCSKHYKSSRGRNAAGLASTPASTESSAKRRALSRRSSSNITANKISSKHLPVKCNSESSRSDEVSSDGEEDDSPSLSPSSSHSCSRAEHSAPHSDSSAPGSVPLEGASFLSSTPSQWSVEEVFRFISSLQGCEELAAQFRSQEIDGQALLLLREDHLIATMNIKLGPALKICASINSLRE
uniref:Polyhomeotic homolog 1 n=1 Tax=Amphilophus citrinellus TaxID=61819 RepID=A0A3Q0RWD9_AMPCI